MPTTLYINSDGTLVVDTAQPHTEQLAALLAGTAELVEAPGRLHTYRLTPLSLWQAAANGVEAAQLIAQLEQASAAGLPAPLRKRIEQAFARYGQLWLEAADAGALLLCAQAAEQLDQIWEALQPYRVERRSPTQALIAASDQGQLKRTLAKAGHPVEDRTPPQAGAPLALALRSQSQSGSTFQLRPYQHTAVERMLQHGSGVVLLPCGAGKTAVGIGVLAALQTRALILCPSGSAIKQWRRELLDKTTLSDDQIGEWSGERKLVGPITLASYQILTQRQHFDRLGAEDWGLVIYDEVHLLPAPIFRVAAQLQSRRRLGLTATLVREDGRERDVFSLIGPQRFALPWRELERQGWIAPARCTEIRLPLPEAERRAYALADGPQQQARQAAENPAKLERVTALVAAHRGERILVIGQYLSQLEALAAKLHAPLLTGRTPQAEREQLYAAFRSGALSLLIVSKVANVAIDLPDANVAIQISGAFGSRQEEAQRLGRILRPKAEGVQARFYTLISAGTREELDGARRQRFLIEQGYRYEIEGVV